METRLFEERRSGEPPRWRRQAAGIAAGLFALVLSVSAVALATALQDPPAEGSRQLAALSRCAAAQETGCAAR